MENNFVVRKNSFRYKDFDYGSCKSYFVTILVKHHLYRISSIVKSDDIYISVPSEAGQIIEKIWKVIPDKFTKVSLDAFVVMPDHFHGIIKINSPSSIISASSGGITGKKNPMLHEHTLGIIIRWFKAKASFEIRRSYDVSFAWQRNYFDSIVWNRSSLIATRKYILNNPAKWVEREIG